METVIKAFAVFVVVLVFTRITGRRTLSQATPFDVVLLLLIAEAGQNVMIGSDGSLTNTILVIGTLVLLDVVMSYLKLRVRTISLLIEGSPTVLIRDGQVLADVIKRARVSTDDILEAARQTQGVSNLLRVRFAILETSGAISIIPYPDADPIPQ
jgi:uncharacterized membrane protein YcaP (DUF421 family)